MTEKYEGKISEMVKGREFERKVIIGILVGYLIFRNEIVIISFIIILIYYYFSNKK